jgi:c-di-GMP-related signal transduction protein
VLENLRCRLSIQLFTLSADIYRAGAQKAMESCIDVEVRPVRYATRQPVFAADGTVIGYKLLFRTDVVSHFSTGSSDDSGTAAIEVSTLLSLDTLCDRRMAFIGCNREVLLQHGLALLPSERVIAEIEPDVAVDDVIYQQCCDLKNGGYRIALADYSPQDPREPIAHLADFIFVDLHRTGLDEIKSIIGFARWRHSGLVATSVETREDADLARKAGFQFFQGNYFRKPEAMRTRTVQTNRAIYLRLLQAVCRPELDWDCIEDLIKSDATIYYRFMRFVNSAGVGIRCEIRSARQALGLLGDDEIRRWCRLSGMFEMSEGRPGDILLSALVRARFAELLGLRIQHEGADLFLLGLLTLMDTILEIPMSAIVDGLSLDDDSKKFLLEHEGPIRPIFELVFAVETGAWKSVVQWCRELRVEEEFAALSYTSAMAWAQSLTDSI